MNPTNRFRELRGDLYGGLTAAVVALPLALAFGVASGVGPLAGLYGAILVGFFAAVFGGTPAQVSGPTGPMTVVMAIVFTHFAQQPAMAFTVVIMGGLFQVTFGLLRFGRYINLVPFPVVSGFMTGIGCIIIVLQLGPLVGHPTPEGVMLARIAALPALLADPRLDALALGAMTLAIVYLTPRAVGRYLPTPLIALVAGTGAGMLFFPDAPVIGAIPAGLPDLQFPAFSVADFPMMLRFGLVLAFLGSIDSLLTSLVADSITRTHHDSDRELLGQGIGNMAAGIFGAIPGAGATMRTVVNVRAGGRTRASGALHAVVLLAVALGAGATAEHIPLAVLAGILLKVGLDIIDWRYLKRVPSAPRAGVLIMLVTLVLTLATDLTTAVAAGMIMASVLFVKRMADAQSRTMKLVFEPGQMADLTGEETEILRQAAGRIVLFHVEGPMSFGSAKDISRMLRSSDQHDVLVVDLTDVPFIDSSASITLEEVILDAQRREDAVVLCGAGPNVRDVLRRIGVTRVLAEGRMLDSRPAALRRAQEILRETPG